MITQPKTPPPAWLDPIRRRWGLWVVVAVILLMAAVRVRLADFPLERDEGEYAYAGQLILQGIPPYQLAYNMKFPGTYGAYALIMAVFGQSPGGIHLGVLGVTTLTTLLLFWLGRRLLDETAGVVAATTYCLMSASPGMGGLQGHATHFAALFATAGACLIWPARADAGWLRALCGGVMFGLAVLMKQHAVFFCLWGLAFCALPLFRRKDVSPAGRLKFTAGLCIGMILPFGLTCLVLWRAGVMEKFWFWTITYAREYVLSTPLAKAPANLSVGLPLALQNTHGLWLAALAGLCVIWFDDRLRQTRAGLAGFALASLLTTVPGLYFREHYFLLTLPAVALLAGCAISAACLKWGGRIPPLPAAWPAWGCALLLALTALLNLPVWFAHPIATAARKIYPADPLFETETFAEAIRTNSTPQARVAVLGSEPEIYFLSHRRSATGYIYAYPLMEGHPFARQMQEEMIREIESARPEFVVLVLVSWSWLMKPESDPRLLDWWTQSYQTNYIPVGIADMKPDEATRYAWGAEAVAQAKLPATGILLYQRKGTEPAVPAGRILTPPP